jgi:hypothetical protein
MAGFEDILRQLFALDPSKMPGGVPAMAAAAPAPAPVAPNTMLDNSPQGKVLADLAARSAATTKAPSSGLFGLPAGPLPDVRGKGKFGAMVTGFSQGMNDTQNAQTAQQAAETARSAANMKTMAALFDIQNKEADQKIKQQGVDQTGAYYKGLIDNAGKTKDTDGIGNAYKLSLARQANATVSGVNDPELRKQISSPIPEIAQAGKEELARRQEQYKQMDQQLLKQAGITGTDPAAPAAPGAPVAPPVASPASAAPAAPVRNVAPGITGAPPADPAAAPADDWVTVRDKKTGANHRFNRATGQVLPLDATTAPATPTDNALSPGD